MDIVRDTFLQPSAAIRESLLIKATSFQKPKVIGIFSSKKLSETDNEIRLDAFHCKYIKRQLLTGDCNIDLKSYEDERKDYEIKYSKSFVPHHKPMMLFQQYLEKFIKQDKFVRCNANRLYDADIICHAKVLIKMIMVHGDFNEKFSLLCTKYKGNIYIMKRTKSHEHQKELINVFARHALYSDNPNTDVNTNDPGVTKFHCVFNWKLHDTNFMYFSGVQGVENDAEIVETDLSKIKIARIKTRLTNFDEKKHRYKTPYWWSQSLLIGNDEIHIAHINDDEVIKSISTIGLDTFLHNNEKRWRKTSCERISFLNLMMELIKLRMILVNCPLTVYEFDFNPKIQKNVHFKINTGRNEFTFLTDKYIDAVKDL